MYPFLEYELYQSQLALNKLKLKKRNKRSVDFLGTIWKWIAGTPDHSDMMIVNGRLNELSDNNNKQYVINRNVVDIVNNLTLRTNSILKVLNDSETLENALIKSVGEKIRILKENLINIEHAINWSKVGIINSFILTEEEINVLKRKIDEDNLENVNLEEGLEFAETKIASSNDQLMFIISLPITDTNVCKSKLIKPVKRDNVIFKIEYSEILICNQNVLAIRKPCKTINDVRICNDDNVSDMTNDECLPNLLKGKKSHCTITNGFHIPKVESIIPGLLLLNEFNDTLQINNELMSLKGTYLIRYQNTTINIADKEYSFTETIRYKPLPAIIRIPSIDSFEDTLTLQSLEQLHINNTSVIKLLEKKQVSSFAVSVSFSVLIVFILVAVIICKYLRIKKSNQTNISSPIPATIQIIDDNPAFIIANADVRN